MKVQGVGARRPQAAAGAAYPKPRLSTLRFHPQRREGIAHALNVIAIQQVGEGGFPGGHRRQEQQAIGEAFGPGDAHRALGFGSKMKGEEVSRAHDGVLGAAGAKG